MLRQVGWGWACPAPIWVGRLHLYCRRRSQPLGMKILGSVTDSQHNNRQHRSHSNGPLSGTSKNSINMQTVLHLPRVLNISPIFVSQGRAEK